MCVQPVLIIVLLAQMQLPAQGLEVMVVSLDIFISLLVQIQQMQIILIHVNNAELLVHLVKIQMVNANLVLLDIITQQTQ